MTKAMIKGNVSEEASEKITKEVIDSLNWECSLRKQNKDMVERRLNASNTRTVYGSKESEVIRALGGFAASVVGVMIAAMREPFRGFEGIERINAVNFNKLDNILKNSFAETIEGLRADVKGVSPEALEQILLSKGWREHPFPCVNIWISPRAFSDSTGYSYYRPEGEQ